MVVKITECTAKKPDRRAMAQVLEEYGDLSASEALEQVGFLLEGSEIELEVADDQVSSAYRALRKRDMEYEIIED